MNCLECRELIQCMMDGDFSPKDQSALAAHVTTCHNCRELQTAARRLLDVLRLAARPEPPAGLDLRICQAAFLQSQRRFRTRRVAWAAAMAAGILAVLSLGSFWKFSLGKPQPSALAIRPSPADLSKPAPSLNHRVEEAGKAVMALTRRAADETVDQTRMLLPQVLPEMPATGILEIEPLLEQPSKSLREIQSGMTAALEPVTSSARRAMDLFLRELQPRERSNKRGS